MNATTKTMNGRQPPMDDWDRHWSAHDTANALNPAQLYRRKLLFDALSLDAAPRPVRLLELGSGSGEFARAALQRFPDVEFVGLDGSAVGVETSRRKVPRASFFQQDFTQPLTMDARYLRWATHAVCTEVLEHLDDPCGTLRWVRPLLAPGCRLAITVPAGPMSAFDRHIGHRRHFTPDLLGRMLTDAGLRIVDLRAAGFPFLNLYRLVVIARGRKLIDDVEGGDQTLPLTTRATMAAFSWLFKLNSNRTTLGWQLVAIATEPPEAVPVPSAGRPDLRR